MKPFIAMLLGLLLFGSSFSSQAQYSPHVDTTGAKRGPYNLVITVGGGISYYPKHIGIPTTLEQTHNGRWGGHLPFGRCGTRITACGRVSKPVGRRCIPTAGG
ncbi:hypothetical protein [Spirosoma sp. KUDC1026]|uniref:hypothetical protein n=1 Tax=Spirosoma sp. KUDC1026 TaxID=2745947 RepID=UPI001E507D5B|nr:hypothetical protein [Spirosoma sp. KUDC1026]